MILLILAALSITFLLVWSLCKNASESDSRQRDPQDDELLSEIEGRKQ